MKVEFKNKREEIISQLKLAKRNVQIAVAWITDKSVFQLLTELLSRKIKVELLINNDYVNNSKKGVDLQGFVDKGGILYFFNSNSLMHNKFAIIDKSKIITGSLNWTYSGMERNQENLLIINNAIISDKYKVEYQLLIKNSLLIKQVIPNEKILQNYEQFLMAEDQKVSNKGLLSTLLIEVEKGTRNIWSIKPGEEAVMWNSAYRESIIPFGFDEMTAILGSVKDVNKDEIYHAYNKAYPEMKSNQSHIYLKFLKELMIGDIILAIKGRSQLIGIGLVKSDVRTSQRTTYKLERKVDWLTSFELEPVLLINKVGMQTISKFVIPKRYDDWKRIKKMASD